MPPTKNILQFAIKTFLFLMLCFAIGRGVQIIMIAKSVDNTSLLKALPSLWYALYLDSATACYGVIILSIIYLLYQLTGIKIINGICQFCILIIIVLLSCIVLGESLLYPEWKTKLNMQALLHFTNPSEVFSTASIKQIAIFVIGSAGLIYIYWKIWKILTKNDEFVVKKWQNILLIIPILGTCVVGVRGGLQPIPIQISDACYSSNAVYNDIAINPIFSLGANYKSYVDFEKNNPYQCMPMSNALSSVSELYKDSIHMIPKWLTVQKPNIIIIYLESWSADNCAFANGDGFTKNLDCIANKGIAFSNCYAAGYASDQGIPAILSGYPASAKTSIINESSKSMHLPSITIDAKNCGYHTGFCFGGQLNYGNIKNYLIQKKVGVIKEQSDIDDRKYHTQRLGISDADMAHYFISKINTVSRPFLYNWFTLSSHAPFDMPSPIKQITKYENNYVNSVIYSDSALGYFMQLAKHQDWYKNTLFVIVADHSHNSHLNNDMHTAERHKIPLVLYGEILAKDYIGKKITYVVSQTDIATTIMQGCGIPFDSKNYPYSKNLFLQMHTASYCYYDGGGIIADSFTLGYSMTNMNRALYAKGKISKKDSTNTKALLQVVFDEFRRGRK